MKVVQWLGDFRSCPVLKSPLDPGIQMGECATEVAVFWIIAGGITGISSDLAADV